MTRTQEVTRNTTGSQRTIFQIECKLPDYEKQNETFALEYKVAVRMDEQEFSDYMHFVVIDTTCQDYDVSTANKFSLQVSVHLPQSVLYYI